MEYIVIVVSTLNLILLIILLFKKQKPVVNDNISTDLKILGNDISKTDATLKQEMSINREEMRKTLKENREELTNTFRSFETSLRATLTESIEQQRVQAEKLNNKLDEKLTNLSAENSKKLDEMRQTVDEKLQTTVEKRFTESFKIISERLEQVHKGLGEMQNLATGVGDLKRVLTNVKTRGTIGEIQLSSILEEILPAEFYLKNAQTKQNSAERVEYAVKMPGHCTEEPLLLPIDSKFPIEDYLRLIDAIENFSATDELKTLNKRFEDSIKTNAKLIRDKYINPPKTTDFAIMFVPTESIYSEVIRRSELFHYLQNDLKITIVGPSNLCAFLNSLSMGFKTLAIEKRSSEVWQLLGGVKTQFSTFGDILAKTKKKLIEATNVIDTAETKSRSIERKLRDVAEVNSIEMIEDMEIGNDDGIT